MFGSLQEDAPRRPTPPWLSWVWIASAAAVALAGWLIGEDPEAAPVALQIFGGTALSIFVIANIWIAALSVRKRTMSERAAEKAERMVRAAEAARARREES